MSSCYVFSALEFFINAGTDTNYLNASLFPAKEVSLPQGKILKIIAENSGPVGKILKIIAKNSGEDNIYIQSILLNGKALNKATIKLKTKSIRVNIFN